MAQPAHKIRTGNLQVIIWRNINREKNSTFYTFDVVRSYKDGDETWKESNSLIGDDPLIMAELLRQAWTWVSRQRQADYDAKKARDKAENGGE